MKYILITGTPGTGKSTFSEHLQMAFASRGATVCTVLVNDLIKSEKLYDEYDSHFDTHIIDDRKVRRFLKSYLSSLSADFCIIETHTVTTLPREIIDYVAVLTARTDVLFDRLQARQYSREKVDENMECEIMRIVLEEAVERFGSNKVHEMASNTQEDIEDNIEVVLDEIL
jgi:adenylate kinase